MTWLAQVAHVARKDLRESRRGLVAYAALVAIAAVHGVGFAPGVELLDLTTLFVVFAGMLVVAGAVQADAPARTDAFWATHPLHPYAVLGAKVLFAAVVVLGIGLVAQAAALAANHLSAAEVARRIPRSVEAYGYWLLAAMLLATLTSDLRYFSIVLVSIPIVLMIASLTCATVRATGPTSISSGASGTALQSADVSLPWVLVPGWLGIAAAVGLLLWVYRARDVGRGVRTAAIVAAAGALLVASNAAWKMAEGSGAAMIGPAAASPAIISAAIPPQRAAQHSIPLVVHVESAPSDARVTLLSSELAVTTTSGRTLHLIGPGLLDLRTAYPPMAGMTWLATPRQAGSDLHTSISVGVADRPGIDSGIARATLNGTIALGRPRVLGSMPLVRGATLRSAGRSVTIQAWSAGSGVASVRLSSRTIGGEEALPPYDGWGRATTFALVNDARREVMPLTENGSGSQNGWLVLPGTGVSARTEVLETGTGAGASMPTLDDAWFRGARLVVFSWVPAGSYAVSVHVAVPPRG